MKIIDSRYTVKSGIEVKKRRHECECGERTTSYEVDVNVFKEFMQFKNNNFEIRQRLREMFRVLGDIKL